MLQRSSTWLAVLLVAALALPTFANHLNDAGFDATVASLGTNGASNGPWYNWGWSGFHPFGGNNPEWWGDSAALYAGTTDGAPDTSGIFHPGFGTSQGISLEGVPFELQVDLMPQENFAAILRVGIQWRDAGGQNEDTIGESSITIDLTDPLTDPPGIIRGDGAYDTVNFTTNAPPNAYYAVPFVEASAIVDTATAEHWCYIDNISLNVVGNLVTNPGFENGSDPSPWVVEGETSLATWGGNPGRHIWWLADDLSATGSVYQPGICAAEGNTYEISITNSFYIYWAADLEFGFKWMAADDETEIAENVTLLTPLGFPPLPYERFTFTATAPAGARFVRPIIRYSNVQQVPSTVDNSAPTDNVVVTLISGVVPDEDGDGVDDCNDACQGTYAGAPVDDTGRPIADLDLDCDVDLADYAIFTQSFAGPQ